MKIWIASDHRGLALKEGLKNKFPQKNWKDLGPFSSSPVDYPDYAEKICENITDQDQGVLVCGTGQGMVIKANRYRHVRAALCWNEQSASLARKHNNANVLCLPGTLIPFDLCEKIFKIFNETEFEEGRHLRRIQKL